MSSSQNARAVREFTRIFKNEHDVEGVAHLFHPEFRHNFDGDLPPGLEGFQVIGRIMNGAFPDVRVTENDLIVAADKVVERSSATGTHSGPLFGLEPTGKTVHWTEIHIYEMRDRQIVQHWVEWSERELREQIESHPVA